MKQILMVFTGGTIGSVATEGTIKPTETAPFLLLAEFARRFPAMSEEVAFKSVQPLCLLSENLTPAVWTTLIEAIEAEHPEMYDGIIVTHGTDTLPYTAAALSFYFHRLSKPLMLVSSNRPLAHAKANGFDNFYCAVEFIRQINEPGVFVPYRNEDQIPQLHRGVRLLASPQLSGDFFSAAGQNYCDFIDGRFLRSSKSFVPGRHQARRISPLFADNVMMIRPYPGLDYDRYNLQGVVAVLHDLYHSGTACSTRQWGDNRSLAGFIARCRQQAVKVYLAPARLSPDAYQSTRDLLEAGAEVIWNTTLEAAYVKLLIAYGNFQYPQEISTFLGADIAGEHIESFGANRSAY